MCVCRGRKSGERTHGEEGEASHGGGQEQEDRDELERLRSENEGTARAQRAASRRSSDEAGGGAPGRWRWPLAIVLLVVGGLLLAAAVPAVWAGRTLLDTDRYTETVAPLAQEPAVRDSVAVTAVDRMFARADVAAQVADALPPKAAFLAPQITSGLQSFAVTTAEKALATTAVRDAVDRGEPRGAPADRPYAAERDRRRAGPASIEQGR